MKKHLLNSPQSEVPGIDSLFAEMILDKALLTFRKEQLEQKIDQSLRDRNKEEFLRLTEELNQIRKDHEEKDVAV
ncbi:IDEAL domain-containing protein [Rossellomorea aquimaris]|nr:IDEAL domain-containing protein [Rossellomorea aquimaris]WRP07554.1 IDEAL domain-containing protein [Rossellomorea aquimaris]